MFTSGGKTKATTDSTATASRIQRLGEGRFSSPPMLMDQMEGSAPAGLIEEVKNYVGIELELVAHSFFLVLIVGFDKRPVNEERGADDVSPGDKAPIAPVEADGAVIAHGEVAAGRNHEVFSLDVIGEVEGPGWRNVSALRWRDGGKIIAEGKIVAVVRHGRLGLRLRLAIEEDYAVAQVDPIAGNADDPLHQVEVGLAGFEKDDDVAAANIAIVDKRGPLRARREGGGVHQHMVAHQQSLFHGGRGNLEILKNEGQGKESDDQHRTDGSKCFQRRLFGCLLAFDLSFCGFHDNGEQNF